MDKIVYLTIPDDQKLVNSSFRGNILSYGKRLCELLNSQKDSDLEQLLVYAPCETTKMFYTIRVTPMFDEDGSKITAAEVSYQPFDCFRSFLKTTEMNEYEGHGGQHVCGRMFGLCLYVSLDYFIVDLFAS